MKAGDLIEYVDIGDRMVTNFSLVGKRGIILSNDEELHPVWKGYYRIMFFDMVEPNMPYTTWRKCYHKCLEVIGESR